LHADDPRPTNVPPTRRAHLPPPHHRLMVEPAELIAAHAPAPMDSGRLLRNSVSTPSSRIGVAWQSRPKAQRVQPEHHRLLGDGDPTCGPFPTAWASQDSSSLLAGTSMSGNPGPAVELRGRWCH
jgi:hypothetical protein